MLNKVIICQCRTERFAGYSSTQTGMLKHEQGHTQACTAVVDPQHKACMRYMVTGETTGDGECLNIKLTFRPLCPVADKRRHGPVHVTLLVDRSEKTVDLFSGI